MAIKFDAKCFLCTMYPSIKDFPFVLPNILSPTNSTEYLLFKTQHTYAIVGLGAITPGYILIIPNKHYETLSEITGEEWKDFLSLKSIVSHHINNIYGGVVFFEHGASSACRIPSGSCVDHAHLHSVAAPTKDFEDEIPDEFIKSEIDTIDDLHKLAKTSDRYLFLETVKGEKYIYQSLRPVLPQFFRRIWAKLSGKDDDFDFSIFPEYENMLATYNNFVNDPYIVNLIKIGKKYEKTN